MRLPDIIEKIKHIPDITKDIFVLTIITLVTFGAYIGGRYGAIESKRAGELRVVGNGPFDKIQIYSDPQIRIPSTQKVRNSLVPGGTYVGSKTGKIYHLPDCPGAKRIREENKLWFQTKSDAEARGYAAAANCPGI